VRRSYRRPKAEVELLDTGGKGEAGGAQPPLGGRGRWDRELLLEDALEHVSIAQFFNGGPIKPVMHDGGCAGELELGK